jgi:hypothetical protein
VGAVGVWLFKLDMMWGVIIAVGLFIFIMLVNMIQAMFKGAETA